jgi:hypothetical protein
MTKVRLGITTLLVVLSIGGSSQAITVPTTTKEINVAVSKKSGHLLDWSRTSQRIQMVLIESPEEAMEKITFSIPGCKKDACGSDASLMLINSRKGRTSGTAAVRVVTISKRGAKSVYRVRIRIINAEVPNGETETEFTSTETRVKPATFQR